MVAPDGDRGGMRVAEPFTIAFVEGVTLAKWTTAWQERRRDVPLAFVPSPADPVAVLHEGTADVSFVRLPVEAEGLSVIPLYEETQVVVLPRDHPLADAAVTVADLAGEDRVPAGLDTGEAVELVAAGGGILVLPQSVARMHARKDVVARPVADAEPTRIALTWLAAGDSPQIEEWVGIVRGRTARSSRSPAEAAPAPPATKRPQPARRPRPIAGRTRPRKPRGR